MQAKDRRIGMTAALMLLFIAAVAFALILLSHRNTGNSDHAGVLSGTSRPLLLPLVPKW
ncbi:hypothetical protein [Azospirillum sp. sgz302134]